MEIEIRLLHLYADLLNLYGEAGNLRLLAARLTDMGCTVTTEQRSICDDPAKITLSDYDMVYLGSGTEHKLLAAVDHFHQLAPQILPYVQAGHLFLATGNAMELLGRSICVDDGEPIPVSGLFDFETTWNTRVRQTGDVLGVCTPDAQAVTEKTVIGFVNKCSRITGVTSPLFTLSAGVELSNDGKTPGEGLWYQTLLATHLIGPLLVRNPSLLEYVAGIIGEQKGVTPDFPDEATEPRYLAYNAALDGLTARFCKTGE